MSPLHFGKRFGDLFQTSYISADLDAAIAHAEKNLGISGFKVSDPEIEVLSYGKLQRLKLRAAMADVGDHQFEIIQPVSGAIEVYTEAVDLSAHILAFHHVAIRVPGDFGAWLALLDEVRASGDAFAYLFPAEPTPAAGIAFCYVDTRARLGHHVEYLWRDPGLAE